MRLDSIHIIMIKEKCLPQVSRHLELKKESFVLNCEDQAMISSIVSILIETVNVLHKVFLSRYF